MPSIQSTAATHSQLIGLSLAESGLEKALIQTDVLFSARDPRSLPVDSVIAAFADDRRLLRVKRADLPLRYTKIALEAGAVPSQSAYLAG